MTNLFLFDSFVISFFIKFYFKHNTDKLTSNHCPENWIYFRYLDLYDLRCESNVASFAIEIPNILIQASTIYRTKYVL